MSSPKSETSDNTNEQELKNKRFPIKRLISFFLLLTGLGLGIIIYQAGGFDFLFKALAILSHSPFLLLLIGLLLFSEWYSDYLRYYVLARHLKIQMPFRFGIKIVFANLFFSYLTPGGTFGAPVTIYMMYKKGIKLSNAIALALIKPFLTFFVMLASGSVIFLIADFSFTPTTKHIIFASSSVVLVLTMMVAITIFFPNTGKLFTDRLFRFFRHIRHKQGAEKTPRLDKIQKGFHSTINAFALFGKSGWRGVFEGLITTIINLFLFVFISVILLKSLGFKAPMGTLWLYSYIYYFLIAFAPTPGASGLAEGGGYFFFQSIGSPQLVSSYIVLWRFLSCYLVMIIGSLLFLRFVKQAHLGELELFEEIASDDLDKSSSPSSGESSLEHSSSLPPSVKLESPSKSTSTELLPPEINDSKISSSLFSASSEEKNLSHSTKIRTDTFQQHAQKTLVSEQQEML